MFKIGDKVRIKKTFYGAWAKWCHDATIKVLHFDGHYVTVKFTNVTKDVTYENYECRFPKSRLDTEFEHVGPPEFTVRIEYRTTDVDEATVMATRIATAIGKPVSVTHV